MNGSGGNGQPGSSFYSYSIRGNPKLSTATTSSGPRGQTRPTDTVRAACHGSAGDPVLTAAGEGSPGPLLGRGGRRWGLELAAEKPAQKHNPQGPQAAGTSQLRGLPPGVGAWEGRGAGCRCGEVRHRRLSQTRPRAVQAVFCHKQRWPRMSHLRAAPAHPPLGTRIAGPPGSSLLQRGRPRVIHAFCLRGAKLAAT